MKKIMLFFSFTVLLIFYNKANAQHLKFEEISTIVLNWEKNYAPQKDSISNNFLINGYCLDEISYKVVIKISGKRVYHRSYNDFANVIVEYMGTDGKYYVDTPSIMHGYEIPPPEEFDKWYSRRDTQIVRTAILPGIFDLVQSPKKYRFQIVYAYYPAKDERSKRLLKSDWIYLEFEK